MSLICNIHNNYKLPPYYFVKIDAVDAADASEWQLKHEC